MKFWLRRKGKYHLRSLGVLLPKPPPKGARSSTPARVGSGRGAADRVQLTARPDRTRPIDAAVALALAVQGATIEAPGSVYDVRGVIAV